MTQLHAGGKFDSNSYKVSGGLHGVGVSVVNALSVAGTAHLARWQRTLARFEGGFHGRAPEGRGPSNGRKGTEVRFLASTETFSNLEYSFETLEKRLRELAFLNSGVRIILTDERPPNRCAPNCFTKAALRNSSNTSTAPKPPDDGRADLCDGERDDIGSKSRCGGTTATTKMLLPFTNNIPQRDGGTHLAGFRGALTRTINNYAQTSGIAKKEKVNFTGDDAREGLTCVLSVKVPDPKFSSQTKDKLVSAPRCALPSRAW